VTEPRRDTNWWGWGDPMRRTELDATALAVLRERIGELEPWPLAARIDDFGLPEARPLPRAVVHAVGADAVFDGKEDRLRHAAGSGYVDLARLRSGRLDDAPDAVLVPADAAAVGRLIDACAANDVAVVRSAAAPAWSAGSSPCAARTRP
jgi:alkyldihydroxyacetonephosphate synthase